MARSSRVLHINGSSAQVLSFQFGKPLLRHVMEGVVNLINVVGSVISVTKHSHLNYSFHYCFFRIFLDVLFL